MAEYFPLLDRAVSGLTDSTAETRRAIYDRARAALIGQLRRMDPPVPEGDIARESAALDEAIARVEAGFAGTVAARPGSAAAPQPAPIPAPAPNPAPAPRPAPPAGAVEAAPVQSARPPAAQPTAAARPVSRPATAETAPAAPPAPPAAPAQRVPPLPTGTAPPVVPPPSRERPVVGQRPAPTIDRPVMPVAPGAGGAPAPSPRVPPRPVPAAIPRGTRPVMALRPASSAPVGLPTAGRLDSDVAQAADAPETAEARAKADPDGSAFGAVLDAAGRDEAGPERNEASRAAGAATTRSRDMPVRPAAPRPRETPRFGWKAAAAGVAGLVLAGGIGVAAYRLRDRPEQVVSTPVATPSVAVATPGKVADRAGSSGNPSADTTAEPTSGATVPAPVGQNGGDTPSPAPSIAVAQRAALLVDAPDDPQRVKTYVGTVVWRLDSVSPGQGQPLATVVKADVDIPDADLKVTMVMQKNPEPQLPASHTIEFHFVPQAGNTLGAVKQVNVPEMRKDDDAPTGDPLSGVPVAITDNYFLVGLTRGAAESQNIRLLTERNWVDMGILFTSGKLGKLTFEKGAAGQRALEDALKAWN